MGNELELTLACGDYEILRGLLDGSVKVDGARLKCVTNMDSNSRHTRFLKGGEFDVAELSASSYFMSRDRGLAIDGIPVFPHRRFRHGFVFVNTSKGIKTPKDLIGKRVGVKAYQATAMLWMRGILESEYGVPHREIDWYSDLDEDIPLGTIPGLKLTRLPAGESVERMLVEGRLDALLHTDLFDAFEKKNPAVARLFPDHRAEEIAYYKRTGIYPIMHVVAIRRALVEEHPWLARNLYRAFNEAKARGLSRMLNPRIVPLAWYREAWEEQQELLGEDPWEYGLTAQNTKTLGAMIGYSQKQGLISRAVGLDELFLDIGEGSKRGTFRV